MSEPVRILAPNPSLMTGEGTNTYLAGDGDLVCIDPGPDDPAHLEAILAAAAPRGRIALIGLTHSHPDHRPLAAALARRTMAPIRCLDPDRAGDGALPLRDGDELATGGVTLRVVHTPGHAADHVCFLDTATRAVFTGDHVLQGMSTVVAWPDGDMSDYMASLARLRTLSPSVIHPGHGSRVDRPLELIDAYLAHRRAREEEVAAALAARVAEATAEDLVPVIYAAYPRGLWAFAALSVRAHLDKLVRDGRAARRETPEGARFRAGSDPPPAR